MYTIRILGTSIHADTPEDVIKTLTTLKNRSVSVHVRKPSGMLQTAFVDVSAEGVVKQSYGEQRALKTGDFAIGGTAFQ